LKEPMAGGETISAGGRDWLKKDRGCLRAFASGGGGGGRGGKADSKIKLINGKNRAKLWRRRRWKPEDKNPEPPRSKGDQGRKKRTHRTRMRQKIQIHPRAISKRRGGGPKRKKKGDSLSTCEQEGSRSIGRANQPKNQKLGDREGALFLRESEPRRGHRRSIMKHEPEGIGIRLCGSGGTALAEGGEPLRMTNGQGQ